MAVPASKSMHHTTWPPQQELAGEASLGLPSTPSLSVNKAYAPLLLSNVTGEVPKVSNDVSKLPALLMPSSFQHEFPPHLTPH
jgi:hypothetical protein